MARILVAGCGYVGSALVRRLVEAGHDAVGVRRSASPAPFRCVRLDLSDGAALTSWLAGEPNFDGVVCTVAAARGDEASYRGAYVEALRALLTSIGATHTKRPLFVFTSSTSVYAQNGGEWVDEASPTEPSGFRGRIQLEAEALVRSWPGAHCSLRLGGIYGPGRTHLAASVRDGAALASAAYSNRIHRDDAAGALVHLLERHAAGRLVAPTLLGVDDEPAPRSEVVAWMAKRLGTLPPAAVDAVASGKRCRNDRIRQSGFAFRYPSYREGYAALLAGDPAFPSFNEP